MAKEIKKIIDSLEEDVAGLGLAGEDSVTISLPVSVKKDSVTQSGFLSFNLEDILVAFKLINKIINIVRKFKKKK